MIVPKRMFIKAFEVFTRVSDGTQYVDMALDNGKHIGFYLDQPKLIAEVLKFRYVDMEDADMNINEHMSCYVIEDDDFGDFDILFELAIKTKTFDICGSWDYLPIDNKEHTEYKEKNTKRKTLYEEMLDRIMETTVETRA